MTAADVARAIDLRGKAFRGGKGQDRDPFDHRCLHVLVEDQATGALVATFRLLSFPTGAEVGESYSAQFYDLSPLAGYKANLVEMGRFCLDPDCHDPDVLRIAWAALTRYVDSHAVGLLFGCTSFAGTDPARYRDAFALLLDRHIGPEVWRPLAKSPDIVRFASRPANPAPDIKRAVQSLPPLLRTYLAMGGWVSDHAVIDADLGTMHVFTALETRSVPAPRAKILRQIAGQG